MPLFRKSCFPHLKSLRSLSTKSTSLPHHSKACRKTVSALAFAATASGVALTTNVSAAKCESESDDNLSKVPPWAARAGIAAAALSGISYVIYRALFSGNSTSFPDPSDRGLLPDTVKKRVRKYLTKFDTLIKKAEKDNRPDLLDDAMNNYFNAAVEAQAGKLGLLNAVARTASFITEEQASQVAAFYFQKAVDATKGKNFEKALKLLTQSMAVQKSRLADGEKNDAFQRSLGQAGKILQSAPMPSPLQKIRLLENGVELFRQLFGPTHPVLAQVWTDLADAHHRTRDTKLAVKALNEALLVQETLKETHAAKGTTLLKLGHCHMAEGNFAKAKELFERAFSIHKKLLSPQHKLSREDAHMIKVAEQKMKEGSNIAEERNRRMKAQRNRLMTEAARRSPAMGGGVAPSTEWKP
eukprot:g2159.t1